LNNLKVIGPEKAAAKLEGSKAFAKEFMQKHDIPTASFRAFNKIQEDEALKYILSKKGPYVLKADGLAGGKGVLIIEDQEQAIEQAKAILNGKFGKAGNTLVIESYLTGLEFSVFALCSGKDYALLPVAKDYKRIGEGDTGLNTGGMGSISPVPEITSEIIERVEKKIIRPTLNGLASEGISYSGFLFFGLMLSNEEPFVIEYNCRLGDPETQVVLPRIENDFIDLLEMSTSGNIGSAEMKISPKTAFCTILASDGYPKSYEKGKEMNMPSEMVDVILAHAGTLRKDGSLFTSGGRVIGAIGLHMAPKKAKELSQNATKEIQFDGKYYRSDIGFDLNI
jgi:phosphoribosylamine--glycine ligase